MSRRAAFVLSLSSMAVLATGLVPAGASTAPALTCRSGRTAYAHGATRLFTTVSAVYACSAAIARPHRVHSGSATVERARTVGDRLVFGLEVGRADGPNDRFAGWLDTTTGRLATTRVTRGGTDSAAIEQCPLAAVTAAPRGDLAMLYGKDGGLQRLFVARAHGGTLGPPGRVYGAARGQVVPSSLTLADGALRYTTPAGVRKTILLT